jgi:hypothetical protein
LKEKKGMKQLTVNARDKMLAEKRDDNHVYPEIQVREVVDISELRDPIRNLEEKKIRDPDPKLRWRTAMAQGSDAVAREPRSAKSSFQLYAASKDLARE